MKNKPYTILRKHLSKKLKRAQQGLLSVLLITSLTGCSSGEFDQDTLDTWELASNCGSSCEVPQFVNTADHGLLDIESEYLPGVVSCEPWQHTANNGMKAQAIAARSWLYTKMFTEVGTDHEFSNSEGDQVYSCNGNSWDPVNSNPDDNVELVQSTALKYMYVTDDWSSDWMVMGFFVAGAEPDGDGGWVNGCEGDENDSDPTGTEWAVTYNWGLSDCNIEMSDLGWTPSDCWSNPHNRGALSQNGLLCLSNQYDKSYNTILKYYYGSDIQVATATEMCEGPPGDGNGDANNDGGINILDVVKIVGYVLDGWATSPFSSENADANDDGIVNVMDVVTVVNWTLCI